MADQTSFLELIKPLNREYQDTWDEPMNANSDKIDTWASAINTEISDARQTKSSLLEFLQEGHNDDGSLKATPEVELARRSFLYGDEDSLGADLDLAGRLDLGDEEVHKAREGRSSLLASAAARAYLPDQILAGDADVNGHPSWLGYTAADAQVDGSSELLWFMIGGYQAKIRKLQQVTVSGATGTKYLHATYQADGVVTVDGSTGGNGATGSDGTKIRKIVDSTKDFTTEDVEVGDILEILAGDNEGRYIIKEVAPGGDNQALIILGVFPGGATSGINYNIYDPMAPTLGYDDALAPAAGKLYIGEAEFDGAAITEVRALHFKDVFVSEWRAVDVSSSPTFEEIFNHNLFNDQLAVAVQVSQVNDGSQPIEELSLATLANTLGVSVDNGTLAFSQGAYDPGTGDSSHAADALTGAVDGSLTGDAYMERSAQTKWTRTQLWVKNVRDNLFYKDYAGAAKDVGYIRVIIRRWG